MSGNSNNDKSTDNNNGSDSLGKKINANDLIGFTNSFLTAKEREDRATRIDKSLGNENIPITNLDPYSADGFNTDDPTNQDSTSGLNAIPSLNPKSDKSPEEENKSFPSKEEKQSNPQASIQKPEDSPKSGQKNPLGIEEQIEEEDKNLAGMLMLAKINIIKVALPKSPAMSKELQKILNVLGDRMTQLNLGLFEVSNINGTVCFDLVTAKNKKRSIGVQTDPSLPGQSSIKSSQTPMSSRVVSIPDTSTGTNQSHLMEGKTTDQNKGSTQPPIMTILKSGMPLIAYHRRSKKRVLLTHVSFEMSEEDYNLILSSGQPLKTVYINLCKKGKAGKFIYSSYTVTAPP